MERRHYNGKDILTDGGRRVMTDGGTAAQTGGGGPIQPGGMEVFDARSMVGGANTGQAGYGIDYLTANNDARASFMVNDSALEYDEWRDLSDAVIEVRKQMLNLVNDLRGAGLTESEDLATLVSRWQTIDDISEDANVGLGLGEAKSDEESPSYGLDGVPLPVFSKDWRIDKRFLMASRQGPGGALDTTVVRQMTRAMSNTIESVMLNGWGRTVDGQQMYGFLNHPDRNQVTGDSWHNNSGDASGSTSDQEDIRQNLLSVFEALENDEYGDGGYWMYLNRTQWQRLRSLLDDFGSGNPGDTNMRTRIQEEFDVELDRVRVTKNVPDGEAVVFAPEPDVVTVGMAEDIQPVEWESPSGDSVFMRLVGAMNLKLRSTSSGQMGVAHLTGLNP